MKATVSILVASLLFAGCAVKPPHDPEATGIPGQEEKGEAPRPKGATRHYMQRLDPDGSVPADAVGRMIEQRDALVAARPLGATNPLKNWKWLGPGNIGGRLRAIVIHPATPNVMWVGSAGGGIWKTTTSGQSWFPLDGFAPFMAVSCMVMDPRNPDRIYAGVVRLPERALHRGDTVYAVVDDRLEPRVVEVVVRSGEEIFVRGDLAPDDRIVTVRFPEIGPGVRVEVR